MNAKFCKFAVPLALALTACAGPAAVPGAWGVTTSAVAPAEEEAKGAQHVFWTLFASSSWPQVQLAAVPLTKKSKATSINANGYNLLQYSSGMHVDKSGQLWILCYGAYNGDPGSVEIFKLPLTSNSAPLYRLILSGTSDPDHLTFDASGNLWVNSHSNNSVLEYTGPFNFSGFISPVLTLTQGISSPSGVALDKKGNLYVSQVGSNGTKSIAIFPAPIANKPPKYLNGLTAPGGLIFDKQGNLYASDNAGAVSAIDRYNANDLKPGSKPSIVDKTGLPKNSYESDFALSAKGDLYLANCGSKSADGIDVYPTSTKPFTSKLAPSVIYTNSKITGIGCAWGIAIK